ncbi:hypothetical protein [Effusibacillus dendaii]|uniref:Uncharacterized protein n=1 Tax=Effusibacillus dendaii TaxID=2743772 RepID=A0A7I8DH96_9BACL|nr:hypothetical protein [Effusibacillus dendaii]BCJ87181.1 hypothetical protein skT53_21660 [Effusibacillus dendaii]
MAGEPFLIALGYGGELSDMAGFEWEFRCKLGLRNAADEAERESFIRDFVANTSPSEPIVLLLDSYDPIMFRAFMEHGKQAIAKYSGLYVFVVAEDESQLPSTQYFLNIEQDPPGETLFPHQMMLDAEGVPDSVLLFIQDRLNVQFYRRDDELMMEFRIEELPVL